jgi:hypothetical protein
LKIPLYFMPSYDDHKDALEEARTRDMIRQRDSINQDIKRQQASSEQDKEGQQEAGKKDNDRQSVHAALNSAKNLAIVANPAGTVSLLKQINLLSDMPYVAAMGAALLKDLLDFVTAETVVISILTSGLCSIFIFMMMLLVGSSGKKKGTNKFIKKIMFLVGGGVADSIPGIDFLPIETLTVVAIYVLELMERKNA